MADHQGGLNGRLLRASSIIDGFRGARPRLEQIRPLGCCADHEAEFDWYRRHHWRDLVVEMERPALDPASA
jgi:hypothetical protein